MNNIKWIVSVLISASLATNVNAAGWYCRHTEGGLVPECPSEFSFLSDCGGYYINNNAAEKGEKVIYLTFDAGYENGNVEKILDVLKEKNITGAFFILEHLAEKNTNLVCRMADEGHLVCNHTAHHKNMTKLNKEEIQNELVALEESCAKIGVTVSKFYRPPEGEIDIKSVKICNELGYTAVMWSFAYADWDNAKQPNEEKSLKKILDGVHPGEILLLHPTSKTNASIIGQLIDKLSEDGWRFGSLEELCV